MVNRHNRLLVAFYVLSDALLGVSAFIFAYSLRFHTALVQLIPITKGLPPLRQYINILPFVALLVPLGLQLQGLYRLRRGRSRVDDFFAVFVGSILAVVFGIFAMLYVQTYFATPAEMCMSLAACSVTALTTRGCAWPTTVTAMPHVRSRMRRPPVVCSQLPCPRSIESQV